MTHFVVLVIGDNVEGQLQPYHEFECTGENDQYVIDVDKTAEARAEYEQHKDDPDYPTFRAFLEGWYGAEHVVYPGLEPDRNGDHKYGYLRVDAGGEAIQYIDRTNPNRKWDWYSIGGRWSGFFLLRQFSDAAPVLGCAGTFGRGYPIDDRTTDQAKKEEIDFEMMAARARQEAQTNYDQWIAAGADVWRADFEYGIKFRPEIDATWQAFWENGRTGPTKKEREAWRAARTPADRESRDDYVGRRTRRAGITRAVVKDGIWMERGRAGWFGMFDDVMLEDEWDRRYWELIESLPGDTMLTVVDCHI